MNPTVEIIPTVDGSEIRRFHQFMQVRYPSIHRVDDTSKRWLVMGFLNHQQYVTPTWHILDLDDRLIPEQPLWVDRGILHVGPTKRLAGDLRVAMDWVAEMIQFD